MKPTFAKGEIVLVKQERMDVDGCWAICWEAGKIVGSTNGKLTIYRIKLVSNGTILTFFNDGSIRSLNVDLDAMVAI